MKLAIFPLLLLSVAGAAGAFPHPYDVQLQVHPPVPWEGQPTQLSFQSWCTVNDPADPVLVRQENTLRVEVRPVEGCVTSWPPPKDEPFTVDAGHLPAGSYTIELWLRTDDAPPDYRPEASFPLPYLARPYLASSNRYSTKESTAPS